MPPGARSATLPTFLYPATGSEERRRLDALKSEGRIRSIGPRLYSSLPMREVPAALSREWARVVSALFPGALLSHRTALEFRPDPDGVVVLTSTTNRDVRYPGLILRFVRGPSALADDPPFLGLRSSSMARMLLENLTPDRGNARAKTASLHDVEQRLEDVLRVDGEAGLQRLRDRAKEIARTLRWPSELARLDQLVGALLGSCQVAFTNPRVRARAIGRPYSTACLGRLQALAAELRSPIADLAEDNHRPDHLRNKAFFEAYFSNYIEGTTFEIEEAEEIAFDGKLPPSRPQDGHDIAGTFRLVSDSSQMRRVPTTSDELMNLLSERHRVLMAARPEALPGELKQLANRAGETHFVPPDEVLGTLERGFDYVPDLEPGLRRAIFVMFLVSDVHPFVDGNGRVARVMMNAELVAAGKSTIIIPTVYRDDYLVALRALTRRERARPLVQALARAQAFSHLDFGPYRQVLAELQRRHWFREPDEARIIS